MIRRRSFLAQLLAAPLAFVAAWKSRRAPIVLEDARLWVNGVEMSNGNQLYEVAIHDLARFDEYVEHDWRRGYTPDGVAYVENAVGCSIRQHDG